MLTIGTGRIREDIIVFSILIMKREIRQDSDPILRQPTEAIGTFDMETERLIDDMIETMRAANGIGLAAPQIGESKKILVCEFSGDKESGLPQIPLTVLCNPEIVEYSKEKSNMVEGCLSFPGMELLISRPKKIKIKGQDRYGKEIEVEADDLFARVLQHEYDHLNSTLMIDHIQETELVFIGTGTLGLYALNYLATDAQYRIKLVVTTDFRSTSRSHKKKQNPIATLVKELRLPILTVDDINSEDIIAKIRASKAKIAIMADFGQIIGDEIINLFPLGILNIHPSLLPRHRGPSPIQQTILEGDRITGVTLLKTVKKMDAGPIISQVKVELRGTETTTILKDYLAELGGSLLLNSLPYYLAGDLKPYPQDEERATFSRLFKKEDGFVNENTRAIEVERKIRAFSDWPKVYSIFKDKRIQITAAHFEQDGTFTIDRVKPEGKNEMTYADFERGYHTKLTFRG